MLDIAESVFEMIASILLKMHKSVRAVFGKQVQILDEFEGEQNIEIIPAEAFLGTLKQHLHLNLQEIEIACLMRVLSKAELQHSILL